MEITHKSTGDIVELELTGRLDGYWCDRLDAELTSLIRDGHHHIRLDCAKVSFLTSAGIGVLVRFYRELGRINGTFQIVNASKPVSTILQVTKLEMLMAPPPESATPTSSGRPRQRFERDTVGFDVFELDADATLTCRALGTTAPLLRGSFGEEHCTSFAAINPTFALGVGAFGAGFAECRSRFGELLSVAGATAYQPGDGTNVADYLIGSGLGADISLLYCLACEGAFSHLLRFDTLQGAGAVGLSRLLAGCFDAASVDRLGVVIVAETNGLVGAALRQSPTAPASTGGFFAHPAVRGRLTFTAEPAFRRSVALAAGVVKRGSPSDYRPSGQLRPCGPDCVGHFHAAAFRFRPLRKGSIDLGDTVTTLFEPDQLLGLLHLLYDDRAIAGVGESEFVRGACWIAPIAGDLPES